MLQTEQEDFWQGAFGDEYTDRNEGNDWIASNLNLFSRIMNRTRGVHSMLELGANRGLNLKALRSLSPEAELSAVEINEKAATALAENVPGVDVHLTSLLEFKSDRRWDLTFTKGVLIHINPERLDVAYEALYRHSAKYVLIAEYYNPAPVEVSYRGHKSKLFKRDFAGELMTQHPDLTLVDYGFVYRGDPNFPQDDLTWFLMQK